MRKFISNIFVFIISGIIYSTGIIIVNYSIIKLYTSPQLVNSDILILGDSYTKHAVNPNLFKSAKNYSKEGEPYILTFWKLKYLSKKTKAKKIILSLSHQNIAEYNDLKFSDEKWSDEMMLRSYSIGNIFEVHKFSIISYVRTIVRQMLILPHLKHFKFLGNYSKNNTSNLTNIDDVINTRFYYKNLSLNLSQQSINYLDSIIVYCDKKNIDLFLIETPVHKDYFKKIPLNIRDSYETLVQEKIEEGVYIYRNSIEYVDSLFLNADHINYDGSIKYTKQLILDLNFESKSDK